MAKRRRGARSAAHRSPRRSFEQLVEQALDGIPSPFSDALDEVAVIVADEPSADQRRENRLADGDTLYGLYEGVPRTEWGSDFASLPDRITLFQRPLEEDFPDPEELADEVRITLIHELAHHLGIDEDRLHELGVD